MALLYDSSVVYDTHAYTFDGQASTIAATRSLLLQNVFRASQLELQDVKRLAEVLLENRDSYSSTLLNQLPRAIELSNVVAARWIAL